jgi:ubiquinone/menaquinone biosynthesis C-methylase UbiE
VTTMSITTPVIPTLKTRLKEIWTAGDYHHIERYMEHNIRDFYERLSIAPGSRLLDVACGSGGLALVAAREGIDATGVDLAPYLIEKARARAEAQGLNARFEEGDAEMLPFADATFDVVTSLIGAMFAPRPDLVAKELMRVCNPGGTIAMANWTARGFVGQMFATVSKFIAPSGMPSPLLWGDEPTVRDRFGAGVSDMTLTRREYILDYPFPARQVVELFRLHYGPINRAFASLNETGRQKLQEELEALWSSSNQGRHGLTIVKAEFLEVVAIRA